MISRWLIFIPLFLPFFSVEVWGGSLTLSREVVGNGEVALLFYKGGRPSLAVVRFKEKLLHMSVGADGAVALVGVDIDAQPGIYPLYVAISDERGHTEFFERALRVKHLERPEEHLRLPQEMVTPRDPKVLKRITRERLLLDTIFADATHAFEPQPFALPVADPVGSPFGLRRVLNGIAKSPHSGVDFRSPRGTSVRASAAGRVVFAGDLYYTGLTVILDHGGGLYSYYAHLAQMLCHPGEWIAQGDALGSVGSTGRSTGPHLHWGVKLRGDRIDPLNLIRIMGRERP